MGGGLKRKRIEICTNKLIEKQVYLVGFEPLPTQVKVKLLVRDIDRNNQSRYLMNNNFLIFTRKLWSGYTANS